MSGTESASPLLGTAGVGSGSRSRSPRAAGARKGQQETLGTSYLGSGLNGIAAALMVYELLVFLATVEEYDRPGLVVLAWLLLVAAFAATVVAIHVGGQRLPRAAYAGLLAVRILATADPALAARMSAFQDDLAATARAKGRALRERRAAGSAEA